MKRYLLVPALTIALAACGMFGSGSTGQQVDLEDLFLRIQVATVDACSFIPKLSSVPEIVGAFNLEAGATAAAVQMAAGQLCNMLLGMGHATPLKEQKYTITVDGKAVEIEGVFLPPRDDGAEMPAPEPAPEPPVVAPEPPKE